MIFIGLLISIALFINTLNEDATDSTSFIPPVKIPLALSANFGELRIDHFHSGLDIKTQGTTGKEVVATAPGYVYRISVSPGGFGNAIYLRHPSGYSTVYGHMEGFTPEINKYVREQQYLKKSFTITIFPPKDKFLVKQGDVIGYSGNSGSSAGPHLHYEIRKSDSENPVNPLLFDFGTGDNIEPVLERLYIYPAGYNSAINGQHLIKKINVAGEHGNYNIPAENKITISGQAGFGIKAYDLLNDSYNKCAVYSLELKIDSITIFRYKMDEFSFYESRYINSHIDYETSIREKIYIERLFVLPNDKLSVYSGLVSNGIFNFADNKKHFVEIELADVNKNRSRLGFYVESQKLQTGKAPSRNNNAVIMPFSRTNRFRAEGISVTIPSGALYDTLFFTYKKEKGNPDMLSDVHYIHNIYTPLHKPFSLSIRPDKIPSGSESKMLIVQMDEDFRKSAVNSSYSDGFVNGEATSFGMFFAGIDTIPPAIEPNSGLAEGADLSGKKEIRIKIYDDLSGIKSYEPFIDGKWALLEYDQKNNILIYRFDPERISKGSNHKLALKVTDNKDNESHFTCDFRW